MTPLSIARATDINPMLYVEWSIPPRKRKVARDLIFTIADPPSSVICWDWKSRGTVIEVLISTGVSTANTDLVCFGVAQTQIVAN